MEYVQTVASLSESMIEKLRTAIELGRWESGEKLTSEQTESAMQAVMIWQAQHVNNQSAEPFIVGPSGELYTGKGGLYQPSPVVSRDPGVTIIKSKV